MEAQAPNEVIQKITEVAEEEGYLAAQIHALLNRERSEVPAGLPQRALAPIKWCLRTVGVRLKSPKLRRAWDRLIRLTWMYQAVGLGPKFLKWKLASMASQLLDQPTPPRPSGIYTKPGLGGGALYRVWRSILRKYSIRKRTSLAQSLLQAKGAMPAPGARFVASELASWSEAVTAPARRDPADDAWENLEYEYSENFSIDAAADLPLGHPIPYKLLRRELRNILRVNPPEPRCFEDLEADAPSFNASFESPRSKSGVFGALSREDDYMLFRSRLEKAYPEAYASHIQPSVHADNQSEATNRHLRMTVEDSDRMSRLFERYADTVGYNLRLLDRELFSGDDRMPDSVRRWDPENNVLHVEHRINARVVAIPEPLKVRFIAAPEASFAYYLKQIQRVLFRYLSKIEELTLISKTVEPEDLLLVAHHYRTSEFDHLISGDYKAATDQLDWVSSAIAAQEVSQALELPKHVEGAMLMGLLSYRFCRQEPGNPNTTPWGEFLNGMWEIGEQRNGQQMGSPVSFPILSLVNLALVRLSQKGSGLSGNRLRGYFNKLRRSEGNKLGLPRGLKYHFTDTVSYPCLINGDDCLFTGNRETYNLWSRLGRHFGLRESVGKTYVVNRESRIQFGTINSRMFIFRGSEFSLPSRVPFLQSGHLIVRPTNEDGRQAGGKFKARGLLEAGPLLRDVVESGRGLKDIRRLFGIHWGKALRESKIPWYLPQWAYGLGLPPPKEWSPSRLDLIQSSWLLKRKRVRSVPRIQSEGVRHHGSAAQEVQIASVVMDLLSRQFPELRSRIVYSTREITTTPVPEELRDLIDQSAANAGAGSDIDPRETYPEQWELEAYLDRQEQLSSVVPVSGILKEVASPVLISALMDGEQLPTSRPLRPSALLRQRQKVLRDFDVVRARRSLKDSQEYWGRHRDVFLQELPDELYSGVLPRTFDRLWEVVARYPRVYYNLRTVRDPGSRLSLLEMYARQPDRHPAVVRAGALGPSTDTLPPPPLQHSDSAIELLWLRRF